MIYQTGQNLPSKKWWQILVGIMFCLNISYIFKNWIEWTWNGNTLKMVMKLKKLWHNISYTPYSVPMHNVVFLQEQGFLEVKNATVRIHTESIINEKIYTWIKSIDGQNRYHADHCGKHEELLWIMVHEAHIFWPT